MKPFFLLVGGYLLSSMFANENRTDDISDWYGTCWVSASSLILSRIGRGIRMLITQSDLLNALYAAYSFSKDSMFIMNSCCITFGMWTTLYTDRNTAVITMHYTIVNTLVNTNIFTVVFAGVMTGVGTCVNHGKYGLIFVGCAYKIGVYIYMERGFFNAK